MTTIRSAPARSSPGRVRRVLRSASLRGAAAGALATALAGTLAFSAFAGHDAAPVVRTRTVKETRVVHPMDYVPILQSYYGQIDEQKRTLAALSHQLQWVSARLADREATIRRLRRQLDSSG